MQRAVIIKRFAGCNTIVGVMDSDDDLSEYLWKRTTIPANTLSCSGAQVRIKVACHSAQNCVYEYSAIGVQGGGADEDYLAAGTSITWDTGSASVTITANTEKWSDWITFAFTKTNVHLIHLQQQGGDATHYRKKDTTTAWGGTVYYQQSAVDFGDLSTTADVTATGTTTTLDGLVGIEVR